MRTDNDSIMQKIDPLETAPEIPARTGDVQMPEGNGGDMKKTATPVIAAVFVVMIILGVGTGYLLTRRTVPASSTASGTDGTKAINAKTFGVADTETFPDTAVGTVEKDGISGEGTNKLIREGGASQTACLSSSVLDLSQFVGKKVKVWGKTMTAKKCPWFMDVGKLELQ